MRSFLGAVWSSRILVTAGIVISIVPLAAIPPAAPQLWLPRRSRAQSIDRVGSSCEVSADVGCPPFGFSLTDSLGLRR